jgi:hypothetical protein
MVEFIDKIRKIYGYDRVVPVLGNSEPAKVFGELPDTFLNPIIVDDFYMYSREELNER